ncbi:MAG: tetratricopeptide repeat protein [candidate division KSB1 bacterium]|nr:tetratricopeptide repeat protein [candidate division KSB1 bacterium]
MNRKHASLVFWGILASAFLFVIRCSSPEKLAGEVPAQKPLPAGLKIDWPKEGTLFPPEMAPASVIWRRTASVKRQLAFVHAGGELLFSGEVSGTTWRPDSLLWERIKQRALRQPVTVAVVGIKGARIVCGDRRSFRVSADSVGAPIFYRAVPLPFFYALHHLNEIRWKLGWISSAKPAPTLLTNLPLCGNCHTFSADGRTLAMDVDYANDKGSYAITEISDQTVLSPEQIITWSDYRREDRRPTFGLLSQISPDGRYVASTVKDRSIFVPKDDLHYSQLFFPIKGIIVIYDRVEKRFFSLPGADDPTYVQSNPNWSPDGRWIYFARSRAYSSERLEQSTEVVMPTEVAEEFISGRKEFKFDIYRVPFNNGRGGVAEPVRGASNNGKSNYFPRISPDGKRLVFCQANNFMLLQPDSKLMMIPVEGGEPQPLSCNTDSMNSWHSWSPNGKWLAFASKVRSAYTDILLTHIDEEGQASPPVLLDHLAAEGYAANIPEFVNRRERWSRIVDGFSNQAHYYFTIGRNKMGEKKPKEALEAFAQAIRLDPTYGRTYILKGHIEFANGLYDEALQSYQSAARYIKDDFDLYQNLGTTLYKLRRFDEAVEAFSTALRLNPKSADAYLGRGLAYAQQEKYAAALKDYDAAAAAAPNNDRIYHERGVVNALVGNLVQAEQDLQTAHRLEPENARTCEKLGDIRYQLQRYAQAVEAYTQAIGLEPQNARFYEARGDARYKLRDLQAALSDYEKVVSLNPRAGSSYYRLGVVRMELGDRAGGCRDLATAAQLGVRQAEELRRKSCR